jgi:formylglycine-generating enzyme required for sulfatase activity/WD40 repeat protein
LEALLGWWEDQGGDPCDARGIADWLWLQASMSGCAIPTRLVAAKLDPGSTVIGDENRPDGIGKSKGTISEERIRSSEHGLDKRPPDPFAATPFPEPPSADGEKGKPTAGLFAESQLPDDDDVRERLRRRKGFVPLLLRQEPMLSRPLTLLAALRPLLQKQPHPHWRVLDEPRTAQRSAELGRPWPVLRPRMAAAVDVEIWLDAGVAMAVWQPLAEEFQRVLASSQAFARVSLLQFELKLLESTSYQRAIGQRTSQPTLLTLVLSDTAGRHWWDGSMARWLEQIAERQPLAVLHTLPLRYRVRTALRRGIAVTLSNRLGLGPNSGYQAVAVSTLDPRRRLRSSQLPMPTGLKLPVFSLNPRDLAPWGALVMGDGLARTGGTVMSVADRQQIPISPVTAPRSPADPAAEAESLWQTFRQQASPEAQRLMLLMAAAPLLTLPVLRLLMAAELPELSDPLPLAEVLVSGLVRRREGQEALGPDAVQFELLPAVQSLLEPQLEPRARVAVIQSITDVVERRLARQGRGPTFETLLSDPRAAESVEASGLAHFANLAADRLDRLPGQPFREIARQLRAAGGRGPTPLWPASMEFKPLPFEPAAVVDVPPTEGLTITAAWLAQLELQRISFSTARVTTQISPGRVVARSNGPQMVLKEPGAYDAVTALIGLPDGRLAAGSADGSIRVWDPASGSVNAVLQGHRGAVCALALLPEGRLASGSGDGTIRLWDLASGSCSGVFGEHEHEHQRGVQALAVLPDGRLASGSRDSILQVRESSAGFKSASFRSDCDGLNALAVLPDGRLALGCGDGRIRFWDLATGASEELWEGHHGGVNALAVLPDGRLASGSDDHTIRLWDASSGVCTDVLQDHQGGIKALLMLANGLLASASSDGTIRIWNLASGDCQQILEGNSGPVQALRQLADGRLIASAEDGCILVWEPIAVPLPRPDPVVGFSSQEATAWGFHEPLQRDHLTFAAVVERPDPLALTLVEIPAGSFLMGSPPDEPERSGDEGPQHQVTLQGFFISQTPITQAQWRQVAEWTKHPAEQWGRKLNPNPSHFSVQPDSDQRPVENVSWHDAMEFCNRLSQRTGRTYTLPSEAQWEYACRAGSEKPFHFGPTITPELANYDGNYTYADGPKGEYRQQTTPGGIFPANNWGLHDMHGNVWEWCLDHWHGSYEGAPADGSAWLNPADPTKKTSIEKGNGSEEELRLLRGGSWNLNPRYCRSAYRIRYRPGRARNFVGFRVVCLPQDPSLNPSSINPSTLAVS